MMHIEQEQLGELLDIPALIKAIRDIFRGQVWTPPRHHHQLENRGDLLIMPSWTSASFGGIKIATVFAGNEARGQATVQGIYILMDAETGQPLATLDARALTLLRTAATSALASSILSRPDAEAMLMVGAGELAIPLVLAHSIVRPFTTIRLWNRTPGRAERLANELAHATEAQIDVVHDLDRAVAESDVISCATMSKLPLIKNQFVREGTHVDLVGAYTPAMRESDSALIEKSSVFVDSRENVLREAGDILIPLSEGQFSEKEILADLYEMCRADWTWSRRKSDVTIFKSVGHAAEDLAAAILAYQRANEWK